MPNNIPTPMSSKIAATSINTVDTMIRQMGKELPISPELPAVLGMDFAGTTEEVGEGVSKYAAGDEVYGCAGGLGDLPGTLAEYLVADANLMSTVPDLLHNPSLSLGNPGLPQNFQHRFARPTRLAHD